MTSPIKPPGGGPPSGIDPTDPASKGAAKGPAGAEGAERAEAFQEALASQQGGQAESVQEAGSIGADLEAGRIDAATAIDRLVAEALSGPMASTLDAAGRAELEAHLRASLEDDPNLAAMVRDLER